jgi:hypothetical protein
MHPGGSLLAVLIRHETLLKQACLGLQLSGCQRCPLLLPPVVQVAEAKVIKYPMPEDGSLRKGCLAQKVKMWQVRGPYIYKLDSLHQRSNCHKSTRTSGCSSACPVPGTGTGLERGREHEGQGHV